MSYDAMIQKAGPTAEDIIALRSRRCANGILRSRRKWHSARFIAIPKINTFAVPSAKKNGFVRYTTDDVEKAVPVARTDPRILQSLAYGEINALAEEFRRA